MGKTLTLMKVVLIFHHIITYYLVYEFLVILSSLFGLGICGATVFQRN